MVKPTIVTMVISKVKLTLMHGVFIIIQHGREMKMVRINGIH